MTVESLELDKPDEEVIGLLTTLLEEALNGNLRCIGVVGRSLKIDTFHAFAGDEQYAIQAIGSCRILEQELINSFISLNREPVFKDELGG